MLVGEVCYLHWCQSQFPKQIPSWESFNAAVTTKTSKRNSFPPGSTATGDHRVLSNKTAVVRIFVVKEGTMPGGTMPGGHYARGALCPGGTMYRRDYAWEFCGMLIISSFILSPLFLVMMRRKCSIRLLMMKFATPDSCQRRPLQSWDGWVYDQHRAWQCGVLEPKKSCKRTLGLNPVKGKEETKEKCWWSVGLWVTKAKKGKRDGAVTWTKTVEEGRGKNTVAVVLFHNLLFYTHRCNMLIFLFTFLAPETKPRAPFRSEWKRCWRREKAAFL